MKFPPMVAGNFDTHFSLANMGKDSRYMLALAVAPKWKLPPSPQFHGRMKELCDRPRRSRLFGTRETLPHPA